MKFGLANNVIEEIQQVLETNPKIDKGIIFGSRAKGNYKDGSDIDIAIKGANLKLDDILALKVKLDDWNLPYDIDLIIYSDIKEPALTDHIDRLGIEFYSSWKEYTLDEVFYFASGLSKSADQFGYGQGFLSFKDIFDNYFIPDELTSLVNSTAKEQESCSIKYGDVFLTRTSETDEDLGMSCVALKDYPKATFNGFTKRLRPKGNVKILPEYAGFYFRSPKFRSAVAGMSSVTTRASLNNGMLSQLKIVIPPLVEQEAVAKTLISLHNKIYLLQRQNETLESIARILFRQRFVEEANINWMIGKAGDAIAVKGGTTPSTKNPDFWNGNIPWTSPKDLANNNSVFLFDTERKISNKGLSQIGSGLLPTGTVLLSSRAPIGYLAITEIPLAINQGYIAIICNEIYSNYYLYLWCKENMADIESAGNGSVFQEISKSSFKDLEFINPPIENLISFNNEIEPLFQKIKNNSIQIHTATCLRDDLLPKLTSGESRLKMR